jgi:hypothetical protein
MRIKGGYMKYKNVLLLTVVCCTLFIAAFDYAEAQNMNIDLGAAHGTPSNTFGAASGQGGVWNTLVLGTTVGLPDITGVATAVNVTVTSDYDDGNAGNDECSGDNEALLDDNIYSNLGNTWTVVLSGLTNGAYTIYLYGPTNWYVPTGNMLVNGVSVPSITGDSCAFVNGTNYTTVQVSITSGTLTISGTNPEGFSGLAGLQLIQQQQESIPSMTEWGMIIFMVLAGLGAICYLRRQRRTES